jgi:tetratricopeptide (TPR) repeat protein
MSLPRSSLTLLLTSLPAFAFAATSAELDKKLGQWYALPEAEKPARYEALLAEFEKSHSENPGDTNIIRGAAELGFARKDFGASSKFYYKLLAIHPHACDAHVRLGIISANGGDMEKAREELAAELKNCPSGNAYVDQLRAGIKRIQAK